MNYLVIALLIGLLILVHEWGHFVAARWMGIPVARFSIGFGPKLWSFRRRETEYWISAIPLGGYVLPGVADEHEYLAIPLYKRLAFCLGGPLANLLLPVVLLFGLHLARGDGSAYGLLVAPWTETLAIAGKMLAAIPKMFAHPEAIYGVVGMVAEGGRSVGLSPARLVPFAVLMSLNLAVVNLLPIPALDGGKIFLHLLETLHPRANRLFVPLSLCGVALLLGLMLYTTVLDIWRLAS